MQTLQNLLNHPLSVWIIWILVSNITSWLKEPLIGMLLWWFQFNWINFSLLHTTFFSLKRLFLQNKGPVHITPQIFENGFVFDPNLSRGISRRHCFRKAPFLECFSSTLKHKAGVFKFVRFEERFRKALFSWRISVDGRPNQRNKATFWHFAGVVWTRPSLSILKFISIFTITTLLHFIMASCKRAWRVRELVPLIGISPKVIPLKLFLDNR